MKKTLSRPGRRVDRTAAFWHVLCFAVPVIIMTIVYLQNEIWPFGGNSLLSMDLWSQYFPMLTAQYDSRKELAVALFSWKGAYGFNSFAQSAYYCNSPFNWLLLLSPRGGLVNALDWLIVLKFGLAALSMSFYLRHKFSAIDIRVAACSVGYSVCAWAIAYINQTMWTDAFVFFPLILLGFERLMSERRPLLYCVTLALTIYSSFYISFSICVFLVIYFVFYLLEHAAELGKRGILEGTGRFALYSLIAGGAAAVCILPIYKAIGLTLASEMSSPEDIGIYHGVFDYTANLLPQMKTSLEYGVPNLYSGTSVFLLIPLFLCNKKISLRRRMFAVMLIVLLFFSMDLNVLNYVWHGFHFPNQLPGRWSFIFSFVLLTLCCETLMNADGLDKKRLAISAGAGAVVIVLTKFLSKDTAVSTRSFIFALLFTAIYALVMFFIIHYQKDKFANVLTFILCAAITAEAAANAMFVVYSHTEVGLIAKYTQFDASMKAFNEKTQDGSGDFYRTEMYENWTFDSPQLYDYNGLTYYSSTMSGSAYEYFRALGQRVYARNVSDIFNPYSPVVNTVSGIKYIASRNMHDVTTGLSKTDAAGALDVLENGYLLPVGFAVSGRAAGFAFRSGQSPLENQNDLFSALTGDPAKVFVETGEPELETKNVTLHEGATWQSSSFGSTDKSAPCEFVYTYTAEKDGDLYLANNFRKGEMFISVNGEEHELLVPRLTHEFVASVKTGDKVTARVTLEKVDMALRGVTFYYFDRDVFERGYEKLKAGAFTDVKDNGNGNISAKISLAADSAVFTSIGDDGGFSVFVDGEKTETKKTADYCLTFDVPAGEHEIEIRYATPGLGAGAAVSAFFIAVFVCAAVFCMRRYKKERDIPAKEEEK
ncbi:MAG: YfhO family protein [Clostridia bacterium]|nr:YfhO family protein [Clostridia bacterium]